MRKPTTTTRRDDWLTMSGSVTIAPIQRIGERTRERESLIIHDRYTCWMFPVIYWRRRLLCYWSARSATMCALKDGLVCSRGFEWRLIRLLVGDRYYRTFNIVWNDVLMALFARWDAWLTISAYYYWKFLSNFLCSQNPANERYYILLTLQSSCEKFCVLIRLHLDKNSNATALWQNLYEEKKKYI